MTTALRKGTHRWGLLPASLPKVGRPLRFFPLISSWIDHVGLQCLQSPDSGSQRPLRGPHALIIHALLLAAHRVAMSASRSRNLSCGADRLLATQPGCHVSIRFEASPTRPCRPLALLAIRLSATLGSGSRSASCSADPAAENILSCQFRTRFAVCTMQRQPHCWPHVCARSGSSSRTFAMQCRPRCGADN